VYRCEATTVGGFVQQLAVAYVQHGYWFYVTGEIPERKCPLAVDAKLIDRHDIAISKWSRARRKQSGRANVQYIRYGRFFVLIATRGEHRFFEDEPKFRDIRRDSLSFAGYSIGYKLGADRKWHVSVRIHPTEYLKLKAYFLDLAMQRSVENLTAELRRIPFEPYAPVRRQFLNILRAVNRKRKKAGYELVPVEALRLRRRMLRPFSVEANQTVNAGYTMSESWCGTTPQL
jgi:hypothetical protein